MRILYICRGDPNGATGAGERIRLQIGALRRLGNVEVVALTHVEPAGSLDVRWLPLLQRPIVTSDRVISLLGFQHRRLRSARLSEQRRLLEPLHPERYDLIWAFTDRAYLALPRGGLPPVVADLVDFEDRRDVELARSGSNRMRFVRVLLSRTDARVLRRTLRGIARDAAATVVSSEIDRQRLGIDSVRVVPNGYSRPGAPLGMSDPSEPPSVLYAGLFAYGPNRDGVYWFISEVWPLFRSRVPGALVRLVGRGLDANAFDAVEGVRVVGWVPSMESELRRATAVVVPLRIGSGTRVKILEAWAHGIPVVSTSVGAEGLGAAHGIHLMRADDPTAIAEALQQVHTDLNLRRRLRASGLEIYEERYTAERIEQQIVQLVRQVLAS